MRICASVRLFRMLGLHLTEHLHQVMLTQLCGVLQMIADLVAPRLQMVTYALLPSPMRRKPPSH